MFSWDILMLSMSQFLNQVPKWLDLPHCKKLGAPKPKTTHTCKVCKEEFAGFYALRQHKSKLQGLNLKKKNDLSPLVDDIDDDSLKKELRACKYFLFSWTLILNVSTIKCLITLWRH